MKKLQVLVAILMIVAGLTACAQPNAVPSAPALSGPAEPTAAEPQKAPVTITFWHAGTTPPQPEATDALVKAFMDKYPWITVKVESFAFGDYFTKLDSSLAAGTAPDVIWVDHTDIVRLAHYGAITPLDPFLPPGWKDDWFASPLQDSTYDGKIWAAPLHQSTEEIIYNKKLAEAAGLKPPQNWEKPWTFAEFRDALEKVSKKGADGSVETWGFMTNYDLSVYNWQPWIEAQGGKIMNEDRTSFVGALDSEETIKAATWFAQLYVDKLAPAERTPDMFQTGKVAFFMSNPFGLNDIKKRFPDLEVGVMPMPCDKKCAVNSGQWEMGITAQSKHQQEAWMLVDFMTNFDGQKHWIDLTGYLPARKSVYEADPALKEHPMNVFMDGLIKYPVHRPISLAYQFFNTTMTAAARDFNLGTDVEAGLRKVAADAQKQLDSMTK